MSALDDAKTLLGVSSADTAACNKLTVIDNIVQARLRNLCNLLELPEAMDPIITDCIINNYRRLGSEHTTSEKQGDYSGNYVEIPDNVMKQLGGFKKMRSGG